MLGGRSSWPSVLLRDGVTWVWRHHGGNRIHGEKSLKPSSDETTGGQEISSVLAK